MATPVWEVPPLTPDVGDHRAAWHANVHWLFASVARSFVTGAGFPPSLPTVQRFIVPRLYRKNAIVLPLGLKLGNCAVIPSLVICVRFFDATSMSAISRRISEPVSTAIVFPSGLQFGWRSSLSPLVSCRRLLPSVFIT